MAWSALLGDLFSAAADIFTPDIFGGNDIDEVNDNAMTDDHAELAADGLRHISEVGGGIMALADAAEGAYASLPQELRDILAGCPSGCGRGCKRGCMLNFCTQRPEYSAQIFNASADCKAAATLGGTRTTIIEARICWAAHCITQPRAPFLLCLRSRRKLLCARGGHPLGHGGVQKKTLHLQGHEGHQARAVLVVFVLSSRGWRRWAGWWCRRCCGSGSAWAAT